jgi:chaperonin GroES
MLTLVLCIFVCCIAVSYGFQSRNTFRKNVRLFGNILDGLPISGDLQPIGNNLLIRIKDAASETKGGLFIPDTAKERPTEGTIVSAGPGRVHSESGMLQIIACKEGEKVIYGKFDGTELKYNDRAHQLIKDDDVLLKYDGDEATLANVVPVKDHILIRLPPKEDKALSGIILTTADSPEKKQSYGTVEKIGEGRPAANGELIPLQVLPGDGVRFRDFGGTLVKLDGGEEFLVIRGYDVMAKW